MSFLRIGHFAALCAVLLLSWGCVGDTGSVTPQCSNELDDDGDGLVDLQDPGCANSFDGNEADDPDLPPPVTECNDGIDNDGDEAIDRQDPDCESPEDNSEAPDDMEVTQCDDGLDNDDDGNIDHPADPGCENRLDNDESDDPELPACGDGVDNDNDGFIDFPGDPGCGSSGDDDETDPQQMVRPQCANGTDDDSDGLVDLADPGCSSVADPREMDNPDAVPACYNQVDDDGDGITDFPYDPGCSAAGDEDEEDPSNLPFCGDGIDNDGDGQADYPNDPGCSGVGDRDETDPMVIPMCSDGVDNDRDGRIDYPEDRGCSSAADSSEGGACGRRYEAVEVEPGRVYRGDSQRGQFGTEGSCGGRGAPEVIFFHRVSRPVEALVIRTDLPDNEVETTLYIRRGCLNPDSEVACSRETAGDGVASNFLRLEDPPLGDYYIFLDGTGGRGGNFAVAIEEVPRAQCLNQEDDDEDGYTDYPVDPGCSRPDDRDETDPPVPPACFDQRDNDNDGVIDYPLDFGCQAAGDDSEVDVCGQGVRTYTYPADAPFILTDTSDGRTEQSAGCGVSEGPEKIFVYDNPFNADLTISVDHEETIPRTLVYVRSECNQPGSELACSEGEDGQMRGSFVLEGVSPGRLYIIVDHPFGVGGAVKLSIDAARLPPGCSDLADNDEDGFIDFDDLGCSDEFDEDERDPDRNDALPACFDQLDNDDDGVIDYPFDVGCFGKGDDNEEDPVLLPACGNDLDDDEDGLTDFPNDPGCSHAGDDDEEEGQVARECSNRRDDDDDGLTDFPNDPGCAAAGDLSEADDPIPPACSDDNDNDQDGLIDYPFDPGCLSAGHRTEIDPPLYAACFNREDDDEDGRTDFPFDPGCLSAADTDEADGGFPTFCSNGRDDDADGLIDFPNDRGCRFAADMDENDPFEIPSRCEDSIDNDADGLIDLRDTGCTSRDDDDEGDPVEVPACGNEVDDDEDGLIDWPEDPGCQARGDDPENQDCRAEVEVIDISEEGRHVGTTQEGGPDRYDNRCGGLEAPDAVHLYELDEPATLVISAANPETNYPVVLSVRRDCEETRSSLGCAGDFARPNPILTLRDAQPGAYYIMVDGGGPEKWVSTGGAINMPPDPQNFVARQDLNANCWSDGGRDAFDCYGRTTLTHGGQTVNLDVSPGQRVGNAGGYGFTYTSELINNVWRLRLEPGQQFDERAVNIAVTGNLGSDGSTQAQQPAVQFRGRAWNYLYTRDNGPSDPPVTHLLVPGDPEELGRVQYSTNRDNVTINANNIKLPATFYVALSYAAPAAVVQALTQDLTVRAGAGGPDASVFGTYELTVTREE